MESLYHVKIFVVLLLLSDSANSIEPISTSIAVGAAVTFSAMLASYDTLKCSVYECCDDRWISPNFTAMHHSLNNQLHGQHLVADVVVKALKGHALNASPSKALVLSFHGWTGGGKNFVSRLIVNSIFKKGFMSQYVHLFVAPLHFPHESQVETYKDQLRDWIKGNTTRCPRSLFVFDEMDKMPDGLLNAIKPFLDHYPEINGVDYRKTTFLFLSLYELIVLIGDTFGEELYELIVSVSNSGGAKINEKTLQHWNKGLPRTDIKYREMEELIILSAYNERGGLWHSSLIESNLITAFVPFLPMERSHVKLCVTDELRRKGHFETDDMKNQVADELHYFPAESKLFSKSGCKKVSEKVDLLYEEL